MNFYIISGCRKINNKIDSNVLRVSHAFFFCVLLLFINPLDVYGRKLFDISGFCFL
jgi:hypothetical protein